jgi:glycerol-3-phosphate dehydrogenase (NAD(P)+)
MSTDRAAVIGAGSWGTALAELLASTGLPTTLWSYEEQVAETVRREHRNARYLPEVTLDKRLGATSDMEEALRDATVVVSVSPSHVVRGVMTQAAAYLRPDALVVSASKGIEN